MLRRNFYSILLIIIVLTIIATTLFMKFTHTTSVVLLTISGWVSFAVRQLYSKSDWFYLMIQKIHYKLTNPDSILNMKVVYTVNNLGEQNLIQIRNSLIQSERLKNVKIMNIQGGGLEVRSEGMILQLFMDGNELEIFILDMPVTYNKAIQLTETVLLPIFEDIESLIHPDQKIYYLRVSFDNINPFYGMYLSKIPKQSIVKFDVKFVLNRNDIEINTDSVTLRASNKQELATLARDYLTLNPKKI